MLGLFSSCGRMMAFLSHNEYPGVSSYLTLAVVCQAGRIRDGAALPLCVCGKLEAFHVSLQALQHEPAGLFMLGDTLPQRVGGLA